ncbi:MAG: 6-pyruvoyl trahydropterin synthase family protein [Bdellovibrionales bacterium]
MFTIHLAKEPFKFSCSHFTILSAEKAERLHGHNYQLRVDITVDDVDPKLGFPFDFNEVKPMIRAFCDELDERILIPTKSPFLKLIAADKTIDVRFGEKNYSFPLEDTLQLPLTNITTEELARYAWQRLAANLKDLPRWTSLLVYVEETRGQGVSFSQKR